ncbi:hypothetical protein Hanom_Chr02g00152271 [Helianthus anomalus]
MEKHIKEVMYESVEKVAEMKRKKEEIIEENVDKMVDKMKIKTEEPVKSEKTDVNTQLSLLSRQTKMNQWVIILKLVNNLIIELCRKCMETCRVYAEKDENLKSRDIEFTKIETVFKAKCKEMFENEEVLKQKVAKLTLKCQDFEKENEILKQKCSANCNECSQKDNIIQELQKEYDGMKFSHHNVKEAYETLKSQVKSMDGRLSKCLETTKLVEANC